MHYAYIQVVKSSFQQVDVASSLSRTQANLVLPEIRANVMAEVIQEMFDEMNKANQ